MDFAKTLIDWYLENRRELPWRGIDDPYRIWLSEVILQQTRVNQGLPYYERFLARFPSVASLAEASEEEVLKLWQGLGYYSRARNLHAAAKVVFSCHGGAFPQSYEEVRALPGVGDYTAAAIVSFAYGLPYPVIDGNVIRFISRYDGVFEEAGSPSCRKKISALLNRRMDKEQAAFFNQGLMEMGALVCLPLNPGCGDCPFASQCYARRHGVIDSLPVKKAKKELIPVYLHYLYLEERGFVWVHKRGYDDLWRGMYDLPQLQSRTGFNPFQSSTDSLVRSKKDSANRPVVSLSEPDPDTEFLQEQKQALSHRLVHFYFYRVKPGSATAVRIKNDQNFQKVQKKSLSQLAVPKGVEKFFRDFKFF